VKGLKNVVFMSLALGMLIYSVPQLDFRNGSTMATVFSVIWAVLSLLVVAAHLHQILGVDEETRKELRRINRMKKWQLEQALGGRRKILQIRK